MGFAEAGKLERLQMKGQSILQDIRSELHTSELAKYSQISSMNRNLQGWTNQPKTTQKCAC
jgi:hypothetical protein